LATGTEGAILCARSAAVTYHPRISAFLRVQS
jgi:hypothetical protein